MLAPPAFLLLVALAATAPVVEYDAVIGKTGTGRCHMEACELFQIQAATPVAALADGTLFALSSVSWETEDRPGKPFDPRAYDKPPSKSGATEPSVYLAFCSKRRGHLFFHADDGSWDVVAITGPESPAGIKDFAYALYWASCHHYVGRSGPSAKLIEKLGYRFTGGGDADDPIKSPADLLKELGGGSKAH